MPAISYNDFFKNILNHPNININLQIDALDYLKVDNEDKQILVNGKVEEDLIVIFTGALDELFGLDSGRLPYRSLKFEWHYENKDSFQPYPVVAYPLEKYTRVTEYNKLPIQHGRGTSYAMEYAIMYDPTKKQEPYYPLLTEESLNRAEIYKSRANALKNFYYCGRLADYKYYNMDQALERAIDVAYKILSREK